MVASMSAWVVDYMDAAGKRRLKTFTTKKAADAWSVQAQHQVASGTHTPDRDSVTVKAAGEYGCAAARSKSWSHTPCGSTAPISTITSCPRSAP